MDNKTILITLFGTGKVINDFTVTLFDVENSNWIDRNVSNYCNNINGLELKDDNWIYAMVVKENQKIKFEKPVCVDFDIINTLDDRAIQKVLREVYSNELGKALKSVKKETLKTIIRNLSKRAAKILLEDMRYMGPIRSKDVDEAQTRIVSIIRHLADIGEISI